MPVSISGAGSISGLDQGFNVTTGSVGIGTDNPTATLQINHASPKIILRDNDNDADISVASIGGAAVYSAASDIIFQTVNTSEKLRITSAGNIGINVIDPDQKLEVDGIIKGSSYFQAGASGTASNNWHFGAEGNGEFRIYSGNYGAGNEKVRITSSGDVLFDTINTNPTANNADGTAILSGGGIRLSRDGEPLGLNRGGSDGVYIDMRRDGTSKATMGVTSNALQFSTAGSERLRITSDGRIGINSTSPQKQLTIRTGSGDNGGILIKPNVNYANNQDRAYLIVGTDAWTGGTTNWSTYGFQHRIKSNSGGTPRITIDGVTGELFTIRNDGNIGIATDNPSRRLDINDGSVGIRDTHCLLYFANTGNNYGTDYPHRNSFIGRADQAGVHITGQDGGYGSSANQMTIGHNGSGGILFGTTNAGPYPSGRMLIDADGRIFTPNQVSFLQRDMTGASFNGGTMSGGSNDHNIGGHYNTSTGIFTAPVAGVYMFGCGVLVNSGSGRLEGNISKNNSVTLVNYNGTGTTYDGPNATCVVNLAANDNIRVKRQSGTAYGPAHGNHYFWGRLMG